MRVEMVPGPLVGAKGGIVARGGRYTDYCCHRRGSYPRLLSSPLASPMNTMTTGGRRGPGDRESRVRTKIGGTSRLTFAPSWSVPMMMTAATTTQSLGMEGAH
jgi:hypothetical protein